MVKLKKIQDMVHGILIDYPETRNSDTILYYRFAQQVGMAKGVDILNLPFGGVLLEMKKLDLPSIESVGRTRRKIQERYPNLAGDEKIQQMRDDQEETYRLYSKGIC